MTKNKTAKLTAAEAQVGLRAAFDGALIVLRDAKAPPTSKASASSTMCKIVEMIQKGGADSKEPYEMSFEEIMEATRVLRLKAEGSDSVFE